MSKLVLTLAVVGRFRVATAMAGVADSPLAAGFTKIVYSTSGVFSRGDIETIFMCTNTGRKNVHVGVEVFTAGNLSLNDPTITALDLPPGTSAAWGTNGFADLTIDRSLGFASIHDRASARIVANATTLVCTVALADPVNSPPRFITPLTLVSKATQKGD